MKMIRLVLLKMIIFGILLNLVTLTSAARRKQNDLITSDEKTDLKIPQGVFEHIKNKRDTSRRNWSRNTASNAYNPPPYLVFNSKTGSYYPYYKFPIENNYIRRNMYKYS
uniref:Uncharacterized protein n=1 Tax=Bombyx mori TaxID=7091 RepID=A0A8R2GCZ9_BOMMO|nr:uncharacterized protein LOC105842592 [Bombyx mori]